MTITAWIALLFCGFIAAGAYAVVWLNKQEKKDEGKRIDFFKYKPKTK